MGYIDSLVSDTRLIDKFIKLQGTENYISSSCFRFWMNDKTVGYDKHWHLELEMILPLKEGYRVGVGEKILTLSEGDILIIPPGISHELFGQEKGLRTIFILDFSLLSSIRGYSTLNNYLSQPVIINETGCPEIYEREIKLLMDLCREYCSDDTLRELEIFPKLIEFFSVYAHYRQAQEQLSGLSSVVSERQRYQIDKLNTVLSYIDYHFTEDLTLEQAAAVAGFSKYHFSRLFKQYSGQNFYEFLCAKRIKYAESLLLSPNIPITEVALRSGFSSLSTFNRIFKKLKECTPTRYRQMYTSPQSTCVYENPFTAGENEHMIERTDFPEEK